MSKMPFIHWSIALAAAAAVGFYIASSPLKKATQTAVLDKVIETFSDETAQTRFMSYATTVTALKRLELAQVNQIEIFERSSRMQILWQQLQLPDVVVRATVPVEYRYYVELNNDWKISMNGSVLNVVAPALITGTPSPDISNLRFEVRKGSLFRNERRVEKALQAELTALLEERAKATSTLAKEPARKQIISLARQWLKSESKEADIHVRFADEASTYETSHP